MGFQWKLIFSYRFNIKDKIKRSEVTLYLVYKNFIVMYFKVYVQNCNNEGPKMNGLYFLLSIGDARLSFYLL